MALNGSHIEAPLAEKLRFVLDFAQARVSVADIASWLRTHLVEHGED